MTSVGSKPACSVSSLKARVSDRDLALDRVGLALLVEGHDDDRRAVAAGEPRLAQELVLAFLQRQRVDDRPALDVLQALFDDRPLGRVDDHRHLGDVGLDRDQVEEARHRRSRNRACASSMLTSIIWAPLSTCCRAIATASSKRSSLISSRERARAGDVGPLADVDEERVGADVERLQAGQARARLDVGDHPRWHALDGIGDGARCGRASCRSRPDQVEQRPRAPAGRAPRTSRAAARRSRRTRWAGRRWGSVMTGTSAMRDSSATYGRSIRAPSAQLRPTANGRAWRTLFQKAPTVWPDNVRPDWSAMVPLTITGRRKPRSSKSDLDGEDRRLAVERVEDRLDLQDVGAAGDQAAARLLVCGDQLVPRDVARAGVVDVGREAGGPVRRAERAGDKARLVGVRGRRRVGGFAGDGRRDAVHLLDDRLEAVVGHRDRRRVERVGLDDVRAGLEVAVVDLAHDLGLGQHQDVVGALQVARVVLEALAAEVRLGQRVALDHRAHRAVEHQDPLAHDLRQQLDASCARVPQLDLGHFSYEFMVSRMSDGLSPRPTTCSVPGGRGLRPTRSRSTAAARWTIRPISTPR